MTSGGLGNQLFHLAVAHTYLEKFPEEKIYLCWNGFKEDGAANFKLFEIINDCKHAIYFRPSNTSYLFFLLVDLLRKYGISVEHILKRLRIVDHSNPCASVVNEEIPPRIARGYFQNADNLGDIRKSVFVKELFMYLSKKTSNNQTKKLQYDFGVHLRRGDYLENKELLGVLSIDYYEFNKLLSGSVVVASDSIELLEEIQSDCPHAEVLMPNIFNEWETLSSLCLAKTLIMANSTFSWWAGILCCHQGNKAIMPNPWFKSGNEVGSHLFVKEFQSRRSIFQ